jgi:CHAT domain-containing protein
LQSRLEAEATAILFEDAFELGPVLLTRKETTKAALFAAAPGVRFVHLATHGWFAPERVKSILDTNENEQSFARMNLEERITGLAPMTLCGLALAGANRGRDSLGRVPGILTAEELCSLNLLQCELAVLSACETNVGIRRAGQGIQSLQAALYAAGARTSITSLWKVDDAATRRLFEVFYTKLWKEKLGKADALWQAKMVLRSEGHPVRDWAGWVLTGDPE